MEFKEHRISRPTQYNEQTGLSRQMNKTWWGNVSFGSSDMMG